MRRPSAVVVVCSLSLMAVAAGPIHPARAVWPSWAWPVEGPVIRPFDPPDSPYGSGHRGIDIAAAIGTPFRAPAAGIVRFAGKIGGYLFCSIDHGGGWESTYSWVSRLDVRRGDSVFVGQLLGATGTGHPGSAAPHLHFGVKLDGAYVDPLSVLVQPSLVASLRLAPLISEAPAQPRSLGLVSGTTGSSCLQCAVQSTGEGPAAPRRSEPRGIRASLVHRARAAARSRDLVAVDRGGAAVGRVVAVPG